MSDNRSDSVSFGEAFKKARLSGRTALFLSAWFGAGLIPKAPGTFGTLTALPLAVAFQHVGGLYAACGLAAFILLAAGSSGQSQVLLGRKDPPEVVIDEAAGLLVTLFLVPPSRLSLALGFVFFRIFDILKPFPIGRLERIGGGTGIVLDDLMAGVYANLCVRVVLFLLAP